MRFHLWKSSELCSSQLPEEQNPKAMPSLLQQLKDAREADKAERKSKKSSRSARDSSKPRSTEDKKPSQEQRQHRDETLKQKQTKPLHHHHNHHHHHHRNKGHTSSLNSKNRYNAYQEFQRAMALAGSKVYTNHESLPTYQNALAEFREMYPRYAETAAIDTLRSVEYGHLDETGRVCLDYCGFGLFSYLQQLQAWESASFALHNISVNLCAHALFGVPREGTVERDIHKRIMSYLKINEHEYNMVFTASRGAAFKLLADAYPFQSCSRLLTMYDYESESVGWMIQRAKEKGAKVSNVTFKWPSLRIVSTKLRKMIVARRRRHGPAKGLFVFPVQSRVSGAKYSYQWMSLAQQNKWHVLVDASAVGPKDMDSLGLSLFSPDFIITSFYKVFGADPTGFGCLLIKNTVISTIQDATGNPSTGIVRISPCPIMSHSSDAELDAGEECGLDFDFESKNFQFSNTEDVHPSVASFSGPMLAFNNRYSPSGETSSNLPSGVMEEDNDSSASDSGGEVPRSPVFSEDGTDNLFCIDIGRSPVASRTSLSEDPYSGPFSGPFSVYDHSGPFSGPFRSSVNNGGSSHLSNSTHQLRDSDSMDSSNVSTSNGNRESQNHLMHKDHQFETSPKDTISTTTKSTLSKTSREIELLNPGKSPSVGVNSKLLNEVADKMENSLKLSEIEESFGEKRVPDQNRTHEIEESSNDKDSVKMEEKLKSKDKSTIQASESAIRRENEFEFRLLGGRKGRALSLSPILQEMEEMSARGSGAEEIIAGFATEDDELEPEVVCRSLDHADMLGLNKTTLRLRYLINWLISSFLQLRHPGPEDNMHLVHLYGPHVKYERGASVAFNLYDCHGKMLHPETVLMLADKHNISLSIGFLRNLKLSDSNNDVHTFLDNKRNVEEYKSSHGRRDHSKVVLSRIQVVTAALSVLSNFEDVYRLWVFVARFLDADFVSKELGRQATAEL